eukprot:TRINITY_DN7281_c0_g2_i1.p1 TRINITY_DN7281_c0_g2~~TRINITY_DN7281_c0_g2_i1.p1  ORF type:complete len:512 (-),score=74.06 TRINITY_DN7281_c0_g2_i1:601-2136(-)
MKELLEKVGVLELYKLIISRWEKKYNPFYESTESGLPFYLVKTVISVLRVSRIGLDGSELDDYVTYTLGRALAAEEMNAWRSFFFKLLDSLFIRNGRYTFFHQLLSEAVDQYYFSSLDHKVDETKAYGLWLLKQCNLDLSDPSMVAEICFALCFGKEYHKLEQFLVQEQVVVSMLSNRYKYEFYGCWRILNNNGFDHKKSYLELAKAPTVAGMKLVGYFQDLSESDYLIPIIQARLCNHSDEDEKAGDYLWLGSNFYDQDSYEQALEYYERSLAIYLKTVGEEHPNVATLYNGIAAVYDSQGRYEEASMYHHKSLLLRTKVLGESHSSVAESYNNIASVYENQGRYNEALEYYHKSLEANIKNLGEDHPFVAACYNNIASTYMNQGKNENVLKYLEKALAINIKTLGEDHPNMASSYNNIAVFHLHQRRFEDALSYFHKSLAIRIKVFGEDHIEVAMIYNNIGGVYLNQKRFDEALDYFHKDIATSVKSLGEEHPDVATTYSNIAGVSFHQ